MSSPTVQPEPFTFSALPNFSRGPYVVDDWVCATDLCGFLAVRESTCLNSTQPSEHDAKISRHLLGLSATQSISLAPLRVFLDERLERENEEGVNECSIFGRAVDVKVVKRWLSLVPRDECRVSATLAPMRQKEHGGEALVFEGDNWKLVIAGLVPSLKFPPVYPAAGANQ